MTEPRVFTVPEPGPEVTCVRDRGGDLWWRRSDGTWYCTKSRAVADAASCSLSVRWSEHGGPMDYLPLIDMTAELDAPAETYPTPEAYEAASKALATLREKFRALAALDRVQSEGESATNIQRVLEGEYDPRDEARRHLLEF